MLQGDALLNVPSQPQMRKRSDYSIFIQDMYSLATRISGGSPELRSEEAGERCSAMGHSGASIKVFQHYVLKTGMEVRSQGERMIQLPSSVVPRVLEMLRDGYKMERLTQPNISGASIVCMHDLLEENLWRHKLPVSYMWYRLFRERFPDLPRPPDSMLNEQSVVTHGDPTIANLLLRPETGKYVICDPMPLRDYLPAKRSLDVGKLLQSCCGWEIMLGVYAPEQILPPIGQHDMYWLGVHAERIRVREGRKGVSVDPTVLRWARAVRDGALDLSIN